MKRPRQESNLGSPLRRRSRHPRREEKIAPAGLEPTRYGYDPPRHPCGERGSRPGIRTQTDRSFELRASAVGLVDHECDRWESNPHARKGTASSRRHVYRSITVA